MSMDVSYPRCQQMRVLELRQCHLLVDVCTCNDRVTFRALGCAPSLDMPILGEIENVPSRRCGRHRELSVRIVMVASGAVSIIFTDVWYFGLMVEVDGE